MRYLEGDVINVEADEHEVTELRSEIRKLRTALEQEKRTAKQSATHMAHATSNLRRQLKPLYQALQQIFGELDTFGASESTDVTPRVSTVWESWKGKLGIGPAKVIDALLLHGQMNTAQLSIATGYHRNTVPQYVSVLNRAGLITKNGGVFSLKKI